MSSSWSTSDLIKQYNANLIYNKILLIQVLVLSQFDIYGYSVHKMFQQKAQHADNGYYSIGKCCNTVTGHLVIALRFSFSAPLAVLNILTRECIASKVFLVSNTEKRTVSVNIKLKEY